MMLAAGRRLGPYEILAAIGAGGMGEVYRARDTRLGREVAVKVLSERLAGSMHAMTRFEREARAVASLSHPNILALHDFGEDDGVRYAVMELLDGEPLNRRMAVETVPAARAAEIGIAVADGLGSAHARGIAHRDIKPANIFLTSDGQVKILDFGLAREEPFAVHGGSVRPTQAAETDPGVVLGTVGYMSPEQVRGEPADHRADIFSLGCVLYEMLTGTAAFPGRVPAETLAAILRDEPAAGDRPLPPRIDAVVRRCLEKKADQRFQSARDLSFALREIQTASLSSPTLAVDPKPVRRRGLFLAAGVAIAVLVGLAAWIFPRFTSPVLAPSSIHSLAVLPLANLSGGRDDDSLADAMTEELTTRLAKLGTWQVTSRTSVMPYRRTDKKIPEIARELGVDAVIEGSIVRDGDRVKVTAQLIDGRTDRHIWADSYERELAGVLTIQRDVARAIAAAVDVTLSPEHHADLAAATRTVLPAAYDAYVRGRYSLDKRSESDLRDAVRWFQQSIDADPTYAPAYAGMADAYGQLGYGSYVAPEDSFNRARAAAEKALALDPTLADAHAALGYSRMYYDWDFKGAEAEYRRSIALNPNYAVAHEWYAYLLTAMERPAAEAEREIATARRLDPLSVPINIDQAYTLHYYDRNEEALRSVRRALEMNPKFPPAYFWLGRIYTSQGRYEEAERALQNIGTLRTWTPAMAVLGYLYAKMGRAAEARSILAEFDDLARQGRYASSYAIAVVHAGLGDREAVMARLNDAVRERSHWLVWLKRDRRWDDVRADPRFAAIVKQVGLP